MVIRRLRWPLWELESLLCQGGAYRNRGRKSRSAKMKSSGASCGHEGGESDGAWLQPSQPRRTSFRFQQMRLRMPGRRVLNDL